MFKRILTHYISSIDQFLLKFDQSHPPSASQQAEIEKYQKINLLRDDPKAKRSPTNNKKRDIWEGF